MEGVCLGVDGVFFVECDVVDCDCCGEFGCDVLVWYVVVVRFYVVLVCEGVGRFLVCECVVGDC